jgi:hypothetical protein
VGNQSYSKEYRLLERRVEELKKTFIEDFINKDTLSMNKKEVELARAYRVLVHAELEAYFESIAIKLLKKATDKWKKNRKANITIIALLARFKAVDKSKEKSKNIDMKINKKESLDTKINRILSDFQKEVINKNHGIKETNITNMLMPLGMEKDDIDSALMSMLDTFGSNRGETAHKSGKVQQPIDIKTEVRNVDFIIEGIKDIEEQINIILKS